MRTKGERVRDICRRENENLNRLRDGKITRDEYERNKERIQGDWDRETGAGEMVRACRRVLREQ